MELRQYQQDCIDDLTTEASNGKKKIILQLPCGAGKTVIASRIIQHATSSGKKCLFLVHRRELLWQAVDKLEKYGMSCGIILAEEPHDPTLPIQVASIQTLYSQAVKRMKITMPKADIVFVDEVHHSLSSKTWQKIIENYKNSYIIGLTATPINRLGRGMNGMFESLLCGPKISNLIDLGHLVPVKYFVPSIPDLKGVKVRQGDYAEDQLEARMDKPELIGDICVNWSRIAPTRKTIVFASSVKHSIHIAERFNSIGVRAEHLDGESEKIKRDSIIKEFSQGNLQVLTNCALFTEGTDIPAASCLVFARPTKSLLLYLQVAGRVLRPFPGKSDAIVIDHAGVIYEHGVIEQDWKWELDYQDRTINELMSRSKKEKSKKQITCGSCSLLYSGQLHCPACGWKPKVRGENVPTYEAYLYELEKETIAPIEDQQKWWQELQGYAVLHQYKRGWAWFKFKEKFGFNPPGKILRFQEIAPGLEVKSWVRHTQIKWAKSKNNPKNIPNVPGVHGSK